MSDTKNTKMDSKETKGISDTQRFCLVELIMILLLVGIVFVFFFGMRQLKQDKAMEALAHSKLEAYLPYLESAIDAAEKYKQNDDFGEYPFDFVELNLPEKDSEDFDLVYDGENYAFELKTKAAFGKAGIVVKYVLADKSFSVEDPMPDRKPVI